VVGAGNTAIDAAVAARRLGASDVRILYRRTEEFISAFDFEYEHAKLEGVRFEWLTQPVGIHVEDGGSVSVECVKVEIDEAGGLQHIAGSNFLIACDLVIPAIGQSPLIEFLSKCRDLKVEKGRVVIDRRTGQTSNAKYYAGGDCVNGGREVVDAVADGKRAGIAIAQSLEVAHAS
jgi:glutamate synthase (NADPH/NADH) small chain